MHSWRTDDENRRRSLRFISWKTTTTKDFAEKFQAVTNCVASRFDSSCCSDVCCRSYWNGRQASEEVVLVRKSRESLVGDGAICFIVTAPVAYLPVIIIAVRIFAMVTTAHAVPPSKTYLAVACQFWEGNEAYYIRGEGWLREDSFCDSCCSGNERLCDSCCCCSGNDCLSFCQLLRGK